MALQNYLYQHSEKDVIFTKLNGMTKLINMFVNYLVISPLLYGLVIIRFLLE